MTVEINFYHVTNGTTHQIAARLCEKIYESNLRAVVYLDTQEELESLDHSLWTYKQKSFLPHASARDGNAELQPFWLTLDLENPNDADVLLYLKAEPLEAFSSFKRVLDIFSGCDEDAVSLARIRWKTYKTQGLLLNYWRQQPDSGRWEKVKL